jgi:hypothetical protein
MRPFTAGSYSTRRDRSRLSERIGGRLASTARASPRLDSLRIPDISPGLVLPRVVAGDWGINATEAGCSATVFLHHAVARRGLDVAW